MSRGRHGPNYKPVTDGAIGTGPCGKKCYQSRRAGKRAAQAIRGQGAAPGGKLRVHECEAGCPPGTWHITSYDAQQTADIRDKRAGGGAPGES